MTDTQSEQVETTDVMPVVEGSEIRLDALRLDGGTRSRAGLDEATVAEYMQTLIEDPDAPFPPVKVVFDGKNHWLVDGFHRIEAAKRANRSYFWAEIIQGTQREAVLMSTGVNASHGLRRTNADKRRAVETLLRDPEWSKWSDREIAVPTATSNRFVGNVRDELAAAAPKPPADGTVNDSQAEGETRTVQRGGKTFEMKVGSIGADKRGGQGADTWALIERGAWKFMSGIYYAIDQRHHIIYYAEAAGNRPLTAAMCEAKYPGCIAVQGASLNSDWQQYQVAGYVFKSPDEFPRQQPIKPASISQPFSPTLVNAQFEGLPNECWFMGSDHKKLVWYTPIQEWEAANAKLREVTLGAAPAGLFIAQGKFLKSKPEFAEYKVVLNAFDASDLTSVPAPVAEQPDEASTQSGAAFVFANGQWNEMGVPDALRAVGLQPVEAVPTNGLTSEVIAKHRRLAEITHFRLINNKCREAGRALQKINYEHGLEAAKIAAKGMTEILADCANDLVKADKEWQQRLDEATQPKKAKWGRKN